MTNNHCPNPNTIRTVITFEMRDKIEAFAKEIADKIYEFAEDQSFDAFRVLPEEWADCGYCERAVLNEQEKALANINLLFVSAIRRNIPIFDN